MNFDPSVYNQTLTGFTTSTGSFPIGGGDCGANVWISDDGMLNLLLSKTDTFSEAAKLMKPGYLKIGFDTPVFTSGNLPSATVHIENSTVSVVNADNTVRLTVAAFANRPLFGIEMVSDRPVGMRVTLRNYRNQLKKAAKDIDSVRCYSASDFDVLESADVVKTDHPACLSWYHHNAWTYVQNTLRNQHLTAVQQPDPLLHRTFGCSVAGDGFALKGTQLCGAPAVRHTLYILAGCEIADHPDAWSDAQADTLCDSLGTYDFDALKAESSGWWYDYYNTFFLRITGDEDAETLTRGYTLQKYMLGCSARGGMPVKFNGSIFTVEPAPEDPENYDYRRWGGAYWTQNTRLIYWNLLYNGHFEGMLPYFDMVCGLIPICRERSRVLFGHEGILLPETYTLFGTYEDCDFGCGQEDAEKPECRNNYIRWHYNGMLEISYMMLKFREYTADAYAGYFEEKLLPFIEGVLQFFREHFPKIDGKMRLQPVSSLETWQDCVNDTPDIAGLAAVIRELKKLGIRPCIEEEDLPPLPLKQTEGRTVIAPCLFSYRPQQQNIEDPELYTLFPFEIYRRNMNPEDRELLENTFRYAPNRQINGWSQMNIWAAMLGDAEFCRKNIAFNFRAKNPDYFFDGCYGPNYDWTPDQDHACANAIATVFMLLQSYGGDAFVAPALPEGWHAEFKLPSSCGIQEHRL